MPYLKMLLCYDKKVVLQIFLFKYTTYAYKSLQYITCNESLQNNPYTHIFVVCQRRLKNGLRERGSSRCVVYSAVNSFLPFILHSGKQCCPVPAGQDWAGGQCWSSLGNIGKVSVCIVQVTAALGELHSDGSLREHEDELAIGLRADPRQYEGRPCSPGRSTRNPTKRNW